MKKKERGILTVEASLILSVFVLFVLFLFNFARVYRAQNMVSHAVLQAADAVAMESYLRETAFGGDEADIVQLANRLTGSITISEESFTSLRSASLPKIAREKFVSAIADSETDADKVLKNLGVQDGLAGVDFSASQMDLDNDDVILYANYTIELQFPILGMKEIEVSKAAKSKTFGEILFALNVIPNNAHYGSVSGGGNYKHGTQVEISASPYYGYTFTGWDTNGDGNPDTGNALKQTITVTGAKTYKAIFKTDKIPVKLSVMSGKGSVQSFSADGESSPSGAYDYQSSVTVVAKPDNGYKFVGWTGYWYKDENGNGRYDSGEHKENINLGEDSANYNINRLEGSYELKAKFKLNVFTISVKSEGVSADVSVYSFSSKKTGKNLSLEYNTQYKLTAPNVSGYTFVGWKKEGGSILGKDLGTLRVPATHVTYVAVYRINPSISIQGGTPGSISTTFTAKTVPNDVNVQWKSSDNNIATVQEGYVVAKRNGTVRIIASFEYNGTVYSDSKVIKIQKSITIEHYCRRDSGKVRHYYKTNPGPNWNDRAWQDGTYTSDETTDYSTVGVWHRTFYVTWSELKQAERAGHTVSQYKNNSTKKASQKLFKQLQGVSQLYQTQWGYNESGEVGYVFDYGSYYGMFFVTHKNAPKPGGGYYDYYIKQIN